MSEVAFRRGALEHAAFLSRKSSLLNEMFLKPGIARTLTALLKRSVNTSFHEKTKTAQKGFHSESYHHVSVFKNNLSVSWNDVTLFLLFRSHKA